MRERERERERERNGKRERAGKGYRERGRERDRESDRRWRLNGGLLLTRISVTAGAIRALCCRGAVRRGRGGCADVRGV